MSLIKCDECGNRISDKSLFCPQCGYPTHLNKGYRGEDRSEEMSEIEKVVKQIHPQAEAVEAPELKTEAPEIPAEETPAEGATVEEPTEEPVEEPYDEENVAEEPQSDEEEAGVRRRNDRAKVWLFLLVSAAVLGAMIYFYFTGVPTSEEGEYEDLDTLYEQVDTTSATTQIPDTLPAESGSVPAVTPPTTVAPSTPVATPVAPAEPRREVEVRSLREQSAPPTHTTPEPTPAVAEPTPPVE